MKVKALTVFIMMLVASAAFAGTIAGVVTDSDGDAVRGATVYLVNPDGNGRGDIVRTVTARDGSFEFVGLDAGVYTVVAGARGYGFTRDQAGVRGRGTTEVELVLPGNGERGDDRGERRRHHRRRRLER
ncbi:MAG: carboxypeptidase-like regulatory domain-containing protein [Candidatus Electryonea clarkiae]|nr:carboxypeptidase-like regulatory domain-containing protein [Candidatus Electryonea clarkiae]MDP8285395.1 carboxypeptidase-like regulatory domain-containing protein [Candidatus Electryonea clarkiae]